MSYDKDSRPRKEFFLVGSHCGKNQFDQIIRSYNDVWIEESACTMDFMQIFVYAAEEDAIKSNVIWSQWRINGESIVRNEDPQRIDHEKIRVFFSPLIDVRVNSYFHLKGPVIFEIDDRFNSSFHIDHLIYNSSRGEIDAKSISIFETYSWNSEKIAKNLRSSIRQLILHKDSSSRQIDQNEIVISGFENLTSIRASHRTICLGILPQLRTVRAGKLSLNSLLRPEVHLPKLGMIDCETISISSNDRSYGTVNEKDFPLLELIRFTNVECSDQNEFSLYRQTFNMKTKLVKRQVW